MIALEFSRFTQSLPETDARRTWTYYLTKGWIEAGDDLFGSYHQMAERYGAEQAERLIKRMLKNYTRLVFINTGKYEVDHYREYSKRIASRYDLKFEEISGSPTLVAKMMNGPWDENFIVVPLANQLYTKIFTKVPICLIL